MSGRAQVRPVFVVSSSQTCFYRFYTGLALMLQEEAAAASEREVVSLLQQGLEYVMTQFFVSHDHKEYVKGEFTFSHFYGFDPDIFIFSLLVFFADDSSGTLEMIVQS